MEAVPLPVRKVLSGCGEKVDSRAVQGRSRASLQTDEVKEGSLEEVWPGQPTVHSAVVPFQDLQGGNLYLNPNFTILEHVTLDTLSLHSEFSAI